MKIKLSLIILASVIFSFLISFLNLSQNQIQAEGFENLKPPFKISIPGKTQGTGTYFEIKDSKYLNVSLFSEKEIEANLESIPRMVSLILSSSTEATTTLTLRGFQPNTKYYKYEDSYKNGTEILTDESGTYSFVQDLTNPHHVWFQEERGTIYLPEHKNEYGTWDEKTRTYTLNKDLTDKVEIVENNFILDGNGHSISGGGSGYGIYISGEKANKVIIKNLKIKNFTHGILVWFASGVEIRENSISEISGDAIYLVVSSEVILNNEISSNNENGIGIYYYARGGEKIQGLIANNVISNNYYGMFLLNQQGTIIENNEIKSNSFGILLSTGESYDISSQNEIRENFFENNYCGLWLTTQTQENFIYHNNFVDNILQAIEENTDQKNFFNKDYSIGGNYWSDYQGKDENDDGIGDKPYCFGLRADSYVVYYGCDNYPFMRENGWKPSIPKPKILISEIYFNPDSLYGATETNEWKNEWIELRNLENREIDISGWKLEDNNTATEIPLSLSIPSGGLAIITSETSTFEFWPEIPEGTIRIVLNKKIGNGLSNESDQIILKDKDGNIIDSVCYGNKENCCEISKKEGISLEKKPFVLKQNTNFCSFFEQEKPNPGKSVLDFYWNKEVKDPKELEKKYEGYEILSAQLILGGKEILKFLPFSISKSFSNVLIASLELEKILNEDYYFEEINEEKFTVGGVGMEIEAQNKNYFLALDLSNSFDFPQFFLSSQDKKEWQILERESENWEIYKFENNVFFILNLDEFPTLPWKTKFISGLVFDDFKNYQVLEETEEILIKKNQPPIPIIKFLPKNPVKEVKVKFNASSSTDPDGEIQGFFWEIKRGEEILATSTATTTDFFFPENGEYQITLTLTDNDGATSSTSTIIKVEPFSFAIITDLHIGRGYPDYGGEGFDDSYNGEEYYLTQRLKNVVKWINDNKENYSFKFVAVLGDIADSAEKSEFCKAKEILDELEIPYIPIFGNHDVWPYTEKESASTTLGEDFFEKIFWSTSSIPCGNSSSTNNFGILLKEFNFERDTQNPKFKNFTFSFGGINFIGLDFNSKEKENCENCGVKGEGVLHNETISWLKNKLNELKGEEPVIIFSHAPFAEPFSRGFYKDSVLQNIIPFSQGNFSREELEKISQILQDYENISEGQQILVNFGGHIHGFEKLGKELKFFGQFSLIDLYFDANWQYPSLSTVPVLTTEALMVGGNEKNLDNKGLVRIVKIKNKESIDFSDIEFKEPALNPYITFEFKTKIVGNFIYPCLIFVPQTFSKREIDYYLWNFDDGKTERTSPLIWEGKTIHCYSPSSLPATYNVTLIAVDKETNKSEYITKKVEIREGIIPKIIKIGEDLKDKFEFISAELGEKVTEFGRTMRDWVWVKVKHSPSTPVGLINVHFEEATGEIDLSQLKTDVDFQNKKSLLYMSQWPPEIERSKILFVPK